VSFGLFLLIATLVSGATGVAVWQLRERLSYALGAAVAGGAVLFLVHGRGYFDYLADDAFITLRYSRNLADGLGPVWNSGERVEGYTTFLWMLLNAGFAKAGLDLVSGSLAVSFLALVASLLLVVGLWRVWAEEEPPGTMLASPFLPTLAILVLGLVHGVSFWGFSAMETPLLMMLITAGVYLHLLERRDRAPFFGSALVLTAAAMTRPEALVLVPVTGAFKLGEALVSERRSREVLRVAIWAALFLALYGAYFLWRYNYYGYLFPNTYYVKVENTLTILSRGISYVQANGLDHQTLPLLIGLGVLAVGRRTRVDASYLLAIVAVWYAAVAYEGGDGFAHGRFIVPILPPLVIGGLYGLVTLLERVSLAVPRSLVWAAPAFALMTLLVAASPWSTGLSHSTRVEIQAVRDRRELGLWLKESIPPNYTIAVWAAGAVSYYSELRSLDLFGLNDPVIAHTRVKSFGHGLPGHERYNLDYVLDDVRPDIIIMTDPTPLILTRERWEELPLGPVEGVNLMIQDPRLWEEYEPVSVEYERGWFNLMVRKDSLAPFRDEFRGE
jgi:arabinofuranosyltransferase